MWILEILAVNLAIVLIIELTLAFILGAKTRVKFSTVALINVVTNPLVVLCGLGARMFVPEAEPFVLLVAEISAFLGEGFTFSKCKIFENKNPYIISFILNLASFTTGEIINKIF